MKKYIREYFNNLLNLYYIYEIYHTKKGSGSIDLYIDRPELLQKKVAGYIYDLLSSGVDCKERYDSLQGHVQEIESRLGLEKYHIECTNIFNKDKACNINDLQEKDVEFLREIFDVIYKVPVDDYSKLSKELFDYLLTFAPLPFKEVAPTSLEYTKEERKNILINAYKLWEGFLNLFMINYEIDSVELNEVQSKIRSKKLTYEFFRSLNKYIKYDTARSVLNRDYFDYIEENVDIIEEEFDRLDSDISLNEYQRMHKILQQFEYEIEDELIDFTKEIDRDEWFDICFLEALFKDEDRAVDWNGFIYTNNLDLTSNNCRHEFKINSDDHDLISHAYSDNDLDKFKNLVTKEHFDAFLTKAAVDNKISIVKILIDLGAEIKLSDKDQNPLHQAMIHNNEEVTEYLLPKIKRSEFKKWEGFSFDYSFAAYTNKSLLSEYFDFGYTPDVFKHYNNFKLSTSFRAYLEGLSKDQLAKLKAMHFDSLSKIKKENNSEYELLAPYLNIDVEQEKQELERVRVKKERQAKIDAFCPHVMNAHINHTKETLKYYLNKLESFEHRTSYDGQNLLDAYKTIFNCKNFLNARFAQMLPDSANAYVTDKDPSIKENEYDDKLNSTDTQQEFYNACSDNELDVVKKYVEQGIDINADYLTFTGLMFACQNRHKEVVEYLLENGASPNVFNRGGDFPINFVYKEKEFEELLMKYGSVSVWYKHTVKLFHMLRPDEINNYSQKEFVEFYLQEIDPLLDEHKISFDSNILNAIRLIFSYGIDKVRASKDWHKFVYEDDFMEKLESRSYKI